MQNTLSSGGPGWLSTWWPFRSFPSRPTSGVIQWSGARLTGGYYELENARDEQQLFIEDGYDTFIGGVTAYSTLGWFDDPLHTGFTSLPEDRMVALMFHELAHRVVYISDDTAFNESFATAVELEGLRLWLETEGDDSGFRKALARLRQRNQTLALIEEASRQLERSTRNRTPFPRRSSGTRKRSCSRPSRTITWPWWQPGNSLAPLEKIRPD